MRLVIPSAKIVSEEFQRIGKLPAIIYPVNQGIVFDYLAEQYAQLVDGIRVVCYEHAEKVHQRLKTYRHLNLDICDLPHLGDLGYTVFRGIADMDEPVIINFGDTIVMDSIVENGGDSFFCSEDRYSSTWTFFETQDGKITRLYDKTEMGEGTGQLFVGVFYIQHTREFATILESVLNQRQTGINSFYRALIDYSYRHPLRPVKTDTWYDIGHADRYFNSRIEVRAREFNHISVDKNRGILKKTSDDREKFIGEIEWYLKLPRDVEYIRPRIFDYSTDYTNPYVSMEYYAYHTLHELYLNGDLARHQWDEIFQRIRFIITDIHRYTVEDGHIRASMEDVYLNKTIQRLSKLKQDKRFEIFYGSPSIINGRRYLPLDDVVKQLEKEIPQRLFDLNRFTIIHGDLCFANMMIDENLTFIKLVDPRGKFGHYDIYGDPRYDLAKLYHSVDGKYDYIIKELYELSYDLDKPEISFTIDEKKRDFDVFGIMKEVLRSEIGDEELNIELIEALLFLSMVPLHGESFEQQLVMLGNGLEILNRVIPIVIEE